MSRDNKVKKIEKTSYSTEESFTYNDFYGEPSESWIKIRKWGEDENGDLKNAIDHHGNEFSFSKIMEERNLNPDLNLKEYIEIEENNFGDMTKRLYKKFYNNSKIFEIILNEHPDLKEKLISKDYESNKNYDDSDEFIHNPHTDQYDEAPFGMQALEELSKNQSYQIGSDEENHQLFLDEKKANITTELLTEYICSVDPIKNYQLYQHEGQPKYKLNPIKNNIQYIQKFDSIGNKRVLEYFSYNGDFEIFINQFLGLKGYFKTRDGTSYNFDPKKLESSFDSEKFMIFDWENRFNRSIVFRFLHDLCIQKK